ncbi:thialysine N-epsilon-acetyltransferase-like [Sitodiplosis mosellana]|uniref:thialysine N-epsilon-acetyltransferase-like n=1 Tax=Sitodiplosis mosellana TaxID=263140 RepID=UPI002443EA06|nr:thialysine N-epsilon-acetyltransferase-like [Sitodiplosis mosellana]
MAFSVRKAIKSDMPAILGLIQELADFEKMPNGPQLTLNDLYRDGGFDGSNTSPLFFCFVAEGTDSSNGSSLGIVGYALCFYTYSTWQGRSVFLEDLYVRPSYRKQGVGKLLFIEIAKHAKEMNANRLELHVLDWNPARKFYEKLGGSNLTEKEGWHYTRYDRQAIESIANGTK